jgi:hypothetical protein
MWVLLIENWDYDGGSIESGSIVKVGFHTMQYLIDNKIAIQTSDPRITVPAKENAMLKSEYETR